jgi:hypothetical protein
VLSFRVLGPSPSSEPRTQISASFRQPVRLPTSSYYPHLDSPRENSSSYGNNRRNLSLKQGFISRGTGQRGSTEEYFTKGEFHQGHRSRPMPIEPEFITINAYQAEDPSSSRRKEVPAGLEGKNHQGSN